MSCNCNQTKPTIKDCSFCRTQTDCDPCNKDHCGCKYTVEAKCVIYGGGDFCIVEAKRGDSIEHVLEKVDEYLCRLVDELSVGFIARNIGEGEGVYVGRDEDGYETFKSIKVGSPYMSITSDENEIIINDGTYSLALEGNSLKLMVTTTAGVEQVTLIDLGTMVVGDTYVERASFSNLTNELTLFRNDGVELKVDLSTLAVDKFVTTGVYTGNLTSTPTPKIELTLNDASTVQIDLDTLKTQIIALITNSQVKPDYLQNVTGASDYIKNRNPSRTITTNYTVVPSDNNYILEIDNDRAKVSINLGGNLGTSEFFVGFIQKGIGEVTFTNYDIKPLDLTDVLYGQGHVAALEIIAGTKYLTGSFKEQ